MSAPKKSARLPIYGDRTAHAHKGHLLLGATAVDYHSNNNYCTTANIAPDLCSQQHVPLVQCSEMLQYACLVPDVALREATGLSHWHCAPLHFLTYRTGAKY